MTDKVKVKWFIKMKSGEEKSFIDEIKSNEVPKLGDGKWFNYDEIPTEIKCIAKDTIKGSLEGYKLLIIASEVEPCHIFVIS